MRASPDFADLTGYGFGIQVVGFGTTAVTTKGHGGWAVIQDGFGANNLYVQDHDVFLNNLGKAIGAMGFDHVEADAHAGNDDWVKYLTTPDLEMLYDLRLNGNWVKK
jgi:hypothetical protein